jgi:hypothetical protein
MPQRQVDRFDVLFFGQDTSATADQLIKMKADQLKTEIAVELTKNEFHEEPLPEVSQMFSQ